MIKFRYAPDGIGEGSFKSSYFKDDMGGNDFLVYIFDKSYEKYAEKCIKHFNRLSDEVINVICYHIIKCAKQDNKNKNFHLPELQKNTDILNYCFFKTMIVSIPGDDSKASYIMQGQGDWGEMIGFVVTENTVTYVGKNYLPQQ